MKPYRIIFAGTPDFAAEALLSLIQSQHEVVAVYTQPDRPAGRGQKLIESAVKKTALAHKLVLEQPLNFKSEESLSILQSYQADLMIVAAYGIILPSAVLNTPRLGCLNIHASLLPRWRGAAPIQRAIAAGDKESGITIMLMNEGLDTGDILLKSTIAIQNTDTGGSLHDKLATLGADLILDALDKLPEILEQRTSQDETLANYARKLSKKEAQIDWSQNVNTINNMVRAFNSWPVAYSLLDTKHIRIWEVDGIITSELELKQYKPGEICDVDNMAIKVACKNGYIILKILQLPGKKALPCAEILNGKKDFFAIGKHFEF